MSPVRSRPRSAKTAAVRPLRRFLGRYAPALVSAALGYGVGMSSAHAASSRLSALRALTADGLGLHEITQQMMMSGGALAESAARASGALAFFGAFGFGVEHSDGAACAGAQSIGFAVLGVVALLVIAIGRMRMVSEHRRLDLARRLIEQGLTPPQGLVVAPARRDLRRGVVLLCAGIGMTVAGLVLGDRGLGAFGLIPAFIGVGYLVSFRLAVGEGIAERDFRSRGDPHDPLGDPHREPSANPWSDARGDPRRSR